MKFELVSHEDDKAVFTAEISVEEFEEAVSKAYNKTKNRISIPGFRKGKAPRKIIENSYGIEVFYEDALDLLIPEAYETAVVELNLVPIEQPELNVKKVVTGEPVLIEFNVITKPVPEIGDMSTIEVTKRSTEVSDAEVDSVISAELRKNVTVVEVEDRAAQLDDKANIDFEGFIDDEAFEGGTGTNFDLKLGSKTFIPGFEDQIIGKSVGDEFDVNVTFPEDYNAEEYAGKEAVFKVKLNSLSYDELPELDDEFAKDVSEFDTLEEYKASIKKDLEEKKAKSNTTQEQNEAIEKLVEMTDVKAPEVMVQKELDHQFEDMDEELSRMGLNSQTYAQYLGKSIDDLREDYRPQAELRVKADLVIDAIADKSNFEITKEEIDSEYDVLASGYSVDDKEAFIARIKNEQTDDYIISNLKRRKAVEKLMDSVKYVEAKDEPETEVEEDSTEK